MADDKKDDKKEEKTFAQKVGTALGYVLLGVVFLWVLGPLLGIGMNGIDGVISAIGNGAHNSTNTLHRAHVDILNFNQRLLQVLFNLATFIALGAFLLFLLKKIIDEIKKWGDKDKK